jgi:hypothetical protein
MTFNYRLFQDFCDFATLQIHSTDIDPVYPVLKESYERNDLPEEIRLWRTFLYVSHYHLGSAEILWEEYPEPGYVKLKTAMNTGIERRGFRGQPDLSTKHINHFIDIISEHGSIADWVHMAVDYGGTEGWNVVREWFEEVKYNGTWASYKWADLMKNVMDYPITASDIGVGGQGEKAGPIPGMVRLTGLDWKTCAEDIGTQLWLLEKSQAEGVPFCGLDQLETSLCDFNSLCKGGYYVGHDIDNMAKQLDQYSDLWESRRNVITRLYLGELNDWDGVRTYLKTLYRDEGIIVWMDDI